MSNLNQQLGHSNRRKVRKGTRSCWECRGRKVKCIFNTSALCEGCIIRGTECVSQELPEHPLAKVDRRAQMRNRIVRVEQLLGSFINENQRTRFGLPDYSSDTENTPGSSQQIPNRPIPSQPLAIDVARANPTPTLTADHTRTSIISTAASALTKQPTILPKYQRMSKGLLANFPTQEFVMGIVKLAGLIPLFFHQMPRSSTGTSQINNTEAQRLVAELVIRHTEMTHPLVVARQMLLLAIAFRYIHPSSHISLRGLGNAERPQDVMRRFGNAAVSMLDRPDSMLETPEGLECLLLASTLHADSGNLHSAWSTTRRAMLLAQMMTLNRKTKLTVPPLQPGEFWDPRVLWHRIVFFDRFFSLALGLPQGSTDNSMAPNLAASGSGVSSPLAHLQAQHCAIAGRILQRNESEDVLQSLGETMSIDHDLQMASQSMPAKWWLIPNLGAMRDGMELYQAAMRLTEQVFHDILLTQLHLPFMIQSILASHLDFHEHSRYTCISASRYLLHRYMALRNFSDVRYCCHSMDFFAVTASVTLLLGYLDNHRSGRSAEPSLHQRQSDRAIMEEILENMTQTGTLDKATALSEKGAGILSHLLEIENRVWQNKLVSSSVNPDVSSGLGQHSSGMSLHLIVPCLGILIVKETGEVIQRPGDELQDTSDRRLDLSTAQPMVLAQSGPQQMAGESHGSDLLGIEPSPVPSIRIGQLDSNEQPDWLIGDAQTACLNSLTYPSGAPDSINTDSWWLL
ncbi:hypothetical protein V8F20_010232 [Naviculisporaceae sp. PSN 640]